MTKCRKCGGECKPSKAFINYNLVIKYVDCLKCEDCGHSFIPKNDGYEEYERMTENRGNIVWTLNP